MKVTSFDIENFRLLEKVTVPLDELATLVVGRNNSGKTSVIEIANKFLGSNKARFRFEDFAISAHKKFDVSLGHWRDLEAAKGRGDDAASAALDKTFKDNLPTISLTIHVVYGEDDNLSSLTPFIMDLDPARKDITLRMEYGPADPNKLFGEFSKSKKAAFIEFLRPAFPSYYTERIFAIDQTDPDRKQLVERTAVSELLMSDFVYAQRHLDDQDAGNSEKLASGFESYYNDNHKDAAVSQELQTLLNETGEKWDTMYAEIFKVLLGDLKTFGYPGLSARELAIRCQFEVEKILKGNTTVFYKHSPDNLLPESYNGLGFKNLIYIILQFVCFVERFRKTVPIPGLHLVFIEEPEVHLHPQMQTAFIRNVRDFIKSKKGWDIQLIITTHSSHIVAEGGFRSIRYFDGSTGIAVVKNLQAFAPTPLEADKFLRQYMTTDNCEMFFADKAVMIEGAVERLLLPAMIRKIDQKHSTALVSQYLSVIEVGGVNGLRKYTPCGT